MQGCGGARSLAEPWRWAAGGVADQTRQSVLLLTGTRTSWDEFEPFEGSLSHPILRHAVHELHLVFSG
jgi:hypothetical protein